MNICKCGWTSNVSPSAGQILICPKCGSETRMIVPPKGTTGVVRPPADKTAIVVALIEAAAIVAVDDRASILLRGKASAFLDLLFSDHTPE